MARLEHKETKIENADGKKVDLYIPRKCSVTGALITPTDHASVQISIAEVDDNGNVTGTSTTFAICGRVRAQGNSDSALNCLATDAGLLDNVVHGVALEQETEQ
jgi:Ribosomal protein S21e